MRILVVTTRTPWPLIDGARIVMYQAIRGLAELNYQIHVIALEEEKIPIDLRTLRRYCSTKIVRPKVRSRLAGALLTLFRRRPYTALKKEIPGLYGYLDHMQGKLNFDAVVVEQSHVASYGSHMKEKHGIPYLLRSHNVEHEIWRRHTDTVRNPLTRAYLELQSRRWKRYEVEEMRKADVIAAITDRDRETIERLAPGVRVETVPAGVDTDRFHFVDVGRREQSSIVQVGGMAWAPNRDAAIWFGNDILPRVRDDVPDAALYLLGSDPPLDELPKNGTHYRIEGFVPDTVEYYRKATVGVVPLRVGGGMRVKILEMMASGLPVVSTAIGIEGNKAIPGEHYLLANTEEEIAAAVTRLLRDPDERRRISENARRFVEEEYSHSRIGRLMDCLLRQAKEIASERRGWRKDERKLERGV